MKLNDQQTGAVERQTGLAPVPEDNPRVEMLKDNFGDHTFYVDKVGLYVWEPVDDEADGIGAGGNGDGAGGQQRAAAVLLAAWADEERTTMRRTRGASSGEPISKARVEPGASAPSCSRAFSTGW